jgi:hypothetical protein
MLFFTYTFINRHKWCNSYFQWNLILVLKHVKKNSRLGLMIRACTMLSEKHNVVLLPEPFQSLNIAWLLGVMGNIFCIIFAVICKKICRLILSTAFTMSVIRISYLLYCSFHVRKVFTSQKYRRRYWLKFWKQNWLKCGSWHVCSI